MAVLTRLTTSTLFEFTVSVSGMTTTMLCPPWLPTGPVGTSTLVTPSTLVNSAATGFAWSVLTRTSIGVSAPVGTPPRSRVCRVS